MRILFFHPLTGYLWRGIERNVVELASSLTELDHEVAILTLRHPERALLDRLDERVAVHEAPRSRYFSYGVGVPWFAWHLSRNRYDAVIVFFGGFGIGPSLAVARRARPVPVYLFLGYPIDVAPHRYDEIERWGLQRTAAGIWAHGEHVAEAAERRFGRAVTPLPTGVDVKRFRADPDRRLQARALFGLRPSDTAIITVSALDERKGIQQVLRALPAIRAAQPGVRYLIAGDGPYRAELEAEIARLRLDGAVTLLGARADVEQVYWAGDLFCLPARGEAGPIAVYEALAAGTPVVTLSVPHLERHIPPGTAEMLAEAAPEAICRTVLDLLADPLRRTEMATRGRRLVAERYSYTALAERVAEEIQRTSRQAVLRGAPVEES
jgi:glycosyltransferase involved in cell wall biosynthesis